MSWIKNLDNKLLGCSRSIKEKVKKYHSEAPIRRTKRIEELKQEVAIEKLNTQLEKERQKRKRFQNDKQKDFWY